MDDILHKYTAGEFIEWVVEQDLDTLTKDVILSDSNDETFVTQVLDEELLKNEFIKSVRKYLIIKRGHTLYIHNNETCEDIMRMPFTDDNYDKISNIANDIVASLNNREINFIGKRRHCCG